jgi:hypothetical protein
VAGVVQRGGRSLIVLAIPRDGIYERGVSNFLAMLHGLKPGNDRGTPKPARTTSPSPSNPPSSTHPAALEVPALPPLVGIKRVTATSTFEDKSKQDLYGAWRTVDYASVADRAIGARVPSTAWCEGKPDEGIGQAITIELASPTQVDAIKVAAGVWKSAKLFESNNRITALDVTVDGTTTTVNPTATRTWLEVPIRRSISSLTLKIAGVTKGKMNDSCLSGVAFVRNNEPVAAMRGVDGAAMSALPRTFVAIQKALRSPQRAGLEQLLDFPFVLHDFRGFYAGQPEPVEYATWKALAAACQRADAATKSVENITCPRPAEIADISTTVRTRGPGQLEVVFPHLADLRQLWRLRWHDGAWHLAAIDYEPDQQ